MKKRYSAEQHVSMLRQAGVELGKGLKVPEVCKQLEQLNLLVVIDELTRECLAIEVGRSFTARDVMLTLQYLLAVRGALEHLHSDNGPEFTAEEIQRWLNRQRHAKGKSLGEWLCGQF